MFLRIPILILLFTSIVWTIAAQKITVDDNSYSYQADNYSRTTLGSVLNHNEEAKSFYEIFLAKNNQSKHRMIVGTSLLAVGIVTSGYFTRKFKTDKFNESPNLEYLLGIATGIGIATIGLIIDISALVIEKQSYKNLNKSIDIFNDSEMIKETTLEYQLKLGTSKNGIKISLAF